MAAAVVKAAREATEDLAVVAVRIAAVVPVAIVGLMELAASPATPVRRGLPAL